MQIYSDVCVVVQCLRYEQKPNDRVMKLSARNKLKGKVIKVEEGLITSKVLLDLGNNNIISAIISKDALDDLELKPGVEAFAIIKSTEVIIGTCCDCKKEKDACACACH